MYSDSSLINYSLIYLKIQWPTYSYVQKSPFTNILSPLRPSIWANLLNEVEEALIQTRLNPLEWMPCHVRMGALECLERAISNDPHPLLNHCPLTLTMGFRTNLPQRISNETFVSFENKTFAVSQKVRAYIVSQFLETCFQKQRCFAEWAILLYR